VGSSFLLTLPRRAGAAIGRPPVPLRPGEAGAAVVAAGDDAAAPSPEEADR
jgi:hypothetical protein